MPIDPNPRGRPALIMGKLATHDTAMKKEIFAATSLRITLKEASLNGGKFKLARYGGRNIPRGAAARALPGWLNEGFNEKTRRPEGDGFSGSGSRASR